MKITDPYSNVEINIKLSIVTSNTFKMMM